jgi:hypothetical protein
MSKLNSVCIRSSIIEELKHKLQPWLRGKQQRKMSRLQDRAQIMSPILHPKVSTWSLTGHLFQTFCNLNWWIIQTTPMTMKEMI